MSSFRVRGKIFAPAPPGQRHLTFPVDEQEATACVAEDAAAFELLRWESAPEGYASSVCGLPCSNVVTELIEESGGEGPGSPPVAGYDNNQRR